MLAFIVTSLKIIYKFTLSTLPSPAIPLLQFWNSQILIISQNYLSLMFMMIIKLQVI